MYYAILAVGLIAALANGIWISLLANDRCEKEEK